MLNIGGITISLGNATTSGSVVLSGKTSGSFTIDLADATAQAVKLHVVAQTVGAGTLNLPNMAGATKTLAWLESPSFTTPALGTPSSGTLTNCTGLPVSTGISGLGTGVATALAANVGSAGAPVVFNGAGGTPSSMTGTNITGTAAGLTAGAVTGFTAGAGVLTGPGVAGVAATLANAQTFTGVKTLPTPIFTTSFTAPLWKPASDSTTAVQITASNGTTAVLTADTTNSTIRIAGSIYASIKLAVSGGPTSPNIVGVYTYGGTYNSFPYYQCAGVGYIWYKTGYWLISAVLGTQTNDFYYADMNGLPTIGSGWTAENGASLGGGTATSSFVTATFYVEGSAYVSTTLSVSHVVGMSPPPGIAAGVGAGTSPTVSVAGTDIAGAVNITTGTLPTGANAVVATITFSSSYAAAPYVTITPANALTSALSGVSMVFITSTTTTFVLNSGTTALTAATSYKWNYHVTG